MLVDRGNDISARWRLFGVATRGMAGAKRAGNAKTFACDAARRPRPRYMNAPACFSRLLSFACDCSCISLSCRGARAFIRYVIACRSYLATRISGVNLYNIGVTSVRDAQRVIIHQNTRVSAFAMYFSIPISRVPFAGFALRGKQQRTSASYRAWTRRRCRAHACSTALALMPRVMPRCRLIASSPAIKTRDTPTSALCTLCGIISPTPLRAHA